MRYLIPLFSLLFSLPAIAQTPGDWHPLTLPTAGPTQIAGTCDGWICRTDAGFYRSTDDGQTWIAIETQNLPNNGVGMSWSRNQKGVMMITSTITSPTTPSCQSSATVTHWFYNCQTHLFEAKFSNNTFSCWHSGGSDVGVSSFNDNSDWFIRPYAWSYGGAPPPCSWAWTSADGGLTWLPVTCDYPTQQHTDSIFQLSADSLWLDPPGPAPFHALQALPVASTTADFKAMAYGAGKICVLTQSTDTLKMFITTDVGATWQEAVLSVHITGSIAFTTAAGHFFIKTPGNTYFAPYSNPAAMSLLHPDGVGAEGVLWVQSDTWWIRTNQRQCLVSRDHGMTWQTASYAGFDPARQATLISDGQHPWAWMDGSYYQLQADESFVKIDSAFATPDYPRLTWKRDSQTWILLKSSLLRGNVGSSWDTVAQLTDGETWQRGFIDGARLYALKYNLYQRQILVLFSDSTGTNWMERSVNEVRDFVVFQDKWFKIDYAPNYQSRMYSSTDLGVTWQPEQPDDWVMWDVFQVYQDQLYATVYVPDLQGRRIARWNALTSSWEIIGTTTGGGNCNAWVADGGFYLLQNTNSNYITFGTCYGDVETALHVPFTYKALINYNPPIYNDLQGAVYYLLWGQRILAQAEQAGIWVADVPDLLHYQTNIDTAVCAGQSVTVGDSLVQQPGTYPLSVAVSALGLDSLTVVNLTVYPVVSVSIDTLLAIGSSFQGWTVTHDTTFIQTLQTTNGCDSTLTIQVQASTSATSNQGQGWAWIGPNPFVQSISLFAESPLTGAAHLQLLDALGRSVWESQQSLHAGLNVLDLPATLSPGSYHLRIKTAGHQSAWHLLRGR